MGMRAKASVFQTFNRPIRRHHRAITVCDNKTPTKLIKSGLIRLEFGSFRNFLAI